MFIKHDGFWICIKFNQAWHLANDVERQPAGLKQLVQLDELAQGQVKHLVHVGNDG